MLSSSTMQARRRRVRTTIRCSKRQVIDSLRSYMLNHRFFAQASPRPRHVLLCSEEPWDDNREIGEDGRTLMPRSSRAGVSPR